MVGPWAEGDTLSPTNLNNRGGGNFPDRTYHVKWAAGSGTTQITNAIANAATLNYPYCFVPKSMLPYDASLVTFNPAVRMVREGQCSWDEYDPLAYGTNPLAARAGIQAALNAMRDRPGLRGGTCRLPEGPYFIDKPLLCQSTGMRFLGPAQGMFAGNQAAQINPTFHGFSVIFDQATAPVGMVSSLVGTGSAWQAVDDEHFFNLRDVKTLDLHGASALTISCYYKPDSLPSQSVIVGSSGALHASETLNQAFAFGSAAGVPYVLLKLTSGTKSVTGGSLVAGTTYYLEADWDGANLYLFYGTPGNTATLIGSVAATGTLIQDVSEEVTHGPLFGLPEQTLHDAGPRGTTDGLHISGVARHTTAFTIPNAKPTADSNTLILLNHAEQVGGCTKASVGASQVAWLWQRSFTSGLGVAGFEFSGINVFGQIADGAGGVAVASNSLNWKIGRCTFKSIRYGIHSPRLESFLWRIEDMYLEGTTGRYAIQSGGGLGLVENVNTLGFQVPIYLSISGTPLIAVFITTQSSTVYGMVLYQTGSGGPPYSCQNVEISTEAGVGSGFRFPLVISGDGFTRGATFTGGAFESGNSAPFVLVDATDSVTFNETSFSIPPSPPASIIQTLGTLRRPIVISNCNQTNPWRPWSNTTGTVVLRSLGPLFSSSTGSALNFDASAADEWDLTLTSDVTQSTWTKISYGQPVSGAIKMDSTGSRLFVWPTNSKGTATLSYGSAAVNTFTGFYDGVNVILTSVRTGL